MQTDPRDVSYTVRAAIAEAAAQHFTTSELRLAFEAAGFLPTTGGSKRDLAREYLRELDRHPTPWKLAEAIVRSIFRAEYKGDEEPAARSGSRDAITGALRDDGLLFDGTRLTGIEIPQDPAFHDAVRAHDMRTVSKSFERAADNVVTDPEDALTAACSLLESLFKTILGDDGIPLPSDRTIKSLWKTVRDHLHLAVTREMEKDLRAILGGLAAIVNGVGDLRTHAGDAHGRDRSVVDVDPRHARLAVSAAQTVATFVLESWKGP